MSYTKPDTRERALVELTAYIADLLTFDAAVTQTSDYEILCTEADLQPLSTTAHLAATAAVTVLVAYDNGERHAAAQPEQ